MEFKIKKDTELDNLNTKNLLAYYKAERRRFYSFISRNTCDCCGERYWHLYGNDEKSKENKKTCDDWEIYLHKIKNVLSKREHIIKTK